MNIIYNRFKDTIQELFNDNDIPVILKGALRSDFSSKSIDLILNEKNNKVLKFFEEFEKLEKDQKFEHFIESTSDISDWIADFLLSEQGGQDVHKIYKINKNLIQLNEEFFVENLEFNDEIIKECLNIGMISNQNYEVLIHYLSKEGVMLAKWKFMNIAHIKSNDCYSKFLYIAFKHNEIFIELYCDDLKRMLEGITDDNEIKSIIKIYSSALVNDNSEVFMMDTPSLGTKIIDTVRERRASPVFNTNPVSPKNKLLDNSSDDEDDDEKIELNKMFEEIQDKSVKDILNFNLSESTTDEDLGVLRFRDYQNELAEEGIEGKNVLICAPTGSGKTVVAIKIIEEHFKTNANGKVAFLVPTNALVDQQYNVFRNHLKKHQIIRQSGNSKQGDFIFSIETLFFDVFVVTCDILRNAFEKNDEDNIRSIGDFSLIIFDECHHCSKSHSYNKIMNHYFTDKSSGLKVPQIIGMTASTGTDKAKSTDDALNTLFTLCANLDCHVVSTVKLNISNLQENMKKASHEILTPDCRYFDDFEDGLIGLMGDLENILSELLDKEKMRIKIPVIKWHDKYMNFISSFTEISIKVSEEVGKDIRILVKYLEVLYRALLINHYFTSKAALELIKALENISRSVFETKIQNNLREFIWNRKLSQDDNPSLECVKNEIIKQVKENDTSRIIVFVKEVSYAKLLEKELNDIAGNLVKCASFVGTNKSAELGGSTNSAISHTIAQFNAGFLNVICCTSVAEEGIDIKDCNLVIRYGNVTNETSMIQTRGRARVDKSRYLVIIPYRFQWQVKKESVNKFRESIMYKAIEKFQNLDDAHISKKIKEHQNKRILQQESSKNFNLGRNNSNPMDDGVVWQMDCKKCLEFLCDSTDIRVINTNSFVLVNKNRFPKFIMETREQNCSKVICNCNNHLGYIQKHSGVFLPAIQIKQFLFKHGNDRKLISKWKDVPFIVKEASLKDLSEANCDKYRT